MVPVGAPLKLTVTEPVNPFSAVMDTWITKEPPGDTVADLGVAVTVKSGGGGGGPDPPPDVLPPPQDIRASNKVTADAKNKRLAEVSRKRRRMPTNAVGQTI